MNLDILGIAETHLTKANNIDLDGYTWFGKNRQLLHVNARNGSGGVGFLIKNELFEEFIVDIADSSCDSILWLQLKHRESGNCIFACVCYLPPNGSSRQVDAHEFLTHY